MALRSPYASEEEWCIVSDNEDASRSLASSDDEVDPEPEFVPRYPSSCYPAHRLPSIELNSPIVEGLLGDVNELQREKAYPHDILRSLLSPEHRAYIDGRLECSEVRNNSELPPGINTKVAFAFRDMGTNKSFPDRLRSTVEAFRPLPVSNEKGVPSYTPVEPIGHEATTQTEFLDQTMASSPLPEPLSRASLFRAALDRSLSLTAQLHAKSQECERLSLEVADLQRQLKESELANQENARKLKRFQRSIAVASDRQTLATECENHHRSIIADLAAENRTLTHQNAVLSGLETDLSGESVLKLEALESALARAMENVRSSLRVKYRAAIDSVARMQDSTVQHPVGGISDGEHCVACLSQLASVRLVPCEHKVLCPACAVRVDKCPIDRLPIKDKVLSFGLNAYTQTE